MGRHTWCCPTLVGVVHQAHGTVPSAAGCVGQRVAPGTAGRVHHGRAHCWVLDVSGTVRASLSWGAPALLLGVSVG
ncbi:MAG: hypothetical protein ACR2F6_16335, partial [Mycobacteriales bacterium]